MVVSLGLLLRGMGQHASDHGVGRKREKKKKLGGFTVRQEGYLGGDWKLGEI